MKQKIIFGLVIFTVLFAMPFLSADCPIGFVCGGTEIEITIQSGLFCTEDGEEWVDYSVSPPQHNPTIGNCYEPDAVGDKFCCPAGSECVPTGQSGPLGELYNCVYTDKNFCWKLEDEESCNNYTKWVAISSIEVHKGEGYCGVDDDWWEVVDGICWYETFCGCEWEGVNQNCTAIDNRTIVCNDTFVPVEEGVCTYTMETWQDNCELDGFIYASWSAIGTGIYETWGARESECQDTEVITIPCEKIVKLDFFTWLNVIVVVLILALIYYSYVKMKKGK